MYKVLLLIIADSVLFLRKLPDTLFLRQLANQQRTLVLRHDIAVETLHNHLLLTDGMHDAVMRVEELDVFSYCGVAVEVVIGLHEQRGPCAEVAPSEVGRTHEYLLHLLHDGVIHRNILAFLIALIYQILLLRRTVYVKHALKQLAYRRTVNSESVHYR